MNTAKNIILIGMMGTMKSTIGRTLGAEFGYEVIDTDNLYEKENGISVNETFSTYGEGYFRNRESEIMERFSRGNSQIICLGGGAILNKLSMNRLAKSGIVVWLQSTPEGIFHRISRSTHRPLLKTMTVENIEKILSARQDMYSAYADIIIDVDRDFDIVKAEIIKEINSKLVDISRD